MVDVLTGGWVLLCLVVLELSFRVARSNPHRQILLALPGIALATVVAAVAGAGFGAWSAGYVSIGIIALSEHQRRRSGSAERPVGP
jgi:hypothetical protein